MCVMDKSNSDSVFINYAEAGSLTETVSDRITWQLLAMANTDVVLSIANGKRPPAAKFDLLFFVQVMREVCGRHEQLRAVLSPITGNNGE
jgi:hypothetical protein